MSNNDDGNIGIRLTAELHPPMDEGVFLPGDRVKLTVTWTEFALAQGGRANVTVEGTVESWGPVDGGGYLTLTDVPDRLRGGWAAPSMDEYGTRRLELIERPQS